MWSTTGATAVVIARTVSLRSSARAARSSAANSRLVIDVPLSSAPMSRAVRGQLDAELVGQPEEEVDEEHQPLSAVWLPAPRVIPHSSHLPDPSSSNACGS